MKCQILFSGKIIKNNISIYRLLKILPRVICIKSAMHSSNYSRLSLSRSPRGSMKHFEVSVLRHIRVERVRKTIN